MESITWAGKDYLGLFNTRRKKSELCFVWSLIFSRVILLVGAIVDLLEVESTAGKQLFFSSLFLSARFIHFSVVGSLSRGMWRSLKWLRFMCLITLKSSGDEPDILTTEVSQFVRPIWLMHGDFTFLTIALTATTVLILQKRSCVLSILRVYRGGCTWTNRVSLDTPVV
ncbi:hypothetical protein YC2023_026200 [Brassica napus]